MKKIKIFFMILALVMVVTSCETYDDYDTNRPVIAGFTFSAKNLKVPNNSTKDLDLEVFITDPAPVDRTFTISVVEDGTQVAPENYSLAPNFVIPANENIGEFTITGIDVSLTDERLPLILQVVATSDVLSGGRITLSVYK